MPTKHRSGNSFTATARHGNPTLWAYRSTDWEAGPRIVVFDYQESLAGAHARAFLQNWRDHLMVDDYIGYKALFEKGPTELPCFAHIRRKFFELLAANGGPGAEEALRRIALLYAIEQQGHDMTPEQRLNYASTARCPHWPSSTLGCW